MQINLTHIKHTCYTNIPGERESERESEQYVYFTGMRTLAVWSYQVKYIHAKRMIDARFVRAMWKGMSVYAFTSMCRINGRGFAIHTRNTMNVIAPMPMRMVWCVCI